MMKIYFFVFLLAVTTLQSQTYTMQNGSFTTCSGTFYDSGGAASAYATDESFQITFCPATPGNYVALNFTSFDVEGAPFDIMSVYEGSGTGGTLIGSYGGTLSPISACGSGTITSSHPSGCLTITFSSDDIAEFTGWVATISCTNIPGGAPPTGPPNAVCSGANPFCANAGPLEFPNISNADCVPNAPGIIPANTCLGTVPNPSWYYLEIDNSGDLTLEIEQTTGPGGTGTGLDVDYAIWGPYTDTSSACANFTLGNVVSCSYSIAAIETATIPAAVTGQIYMVLITNFNGAPGYITMTQTNAGATGAGSTDCTIVCPVAIGKNPSCGVSDGFITISGLDPGTAYNITYLDDGVPVAITLTSNAAGHVVINGLNAGNYTNILTNFAGCNAAPSNVVLTAIVPPAFTSVTGTSPICSGSNAVFTLTGSANAVITYTINSGGAQTIALNGAGTATVTVNSVTSNTTLTVIQIANPVTLCTVAVSASQVINVIVLPTANINYAGAPFCTSTPGTSAVTLTGTGTFSGGTYSATPSTGLVLNASTGAISTAGSTPGNYTVKYTLPGSGGCPGVVATTNITVTAKVTAFISYPASSYCTSAPPQGVTLTGTGAFMGGIFSAAPSGLSIDSATGIITPSASTAGSYIITYFIPGANGCGNVSVTASSITIADSASAVISYAAPLFCTSEGNQNVTLTGTGAFVGGVYSATPTGLTINLSSGIITPATSLAGDYTVTYTLSLIGGCPPIVVTTLVTIIAATTVSLNYPSSIFCTNAPIQNALLTGTGTFTGGNYSVSPAGLDVDIITGSITPANSAPGNYIITYSVSSGGLCPPAVATKSITITSGTIANISYPGASFCKNASPKAVTLTGTGTFTGGTYTSLPSGLIMNSSTGTITPGSSSPGNYTVTYTVFGGTGCGPVLATTMVTITNSGTVTISYTANTFCNSDSAQNATLSGTGTITGGTYSSTPAGLAINSATGTITPSGSNPGNYTVNYSVPDTGGCGPLTATKAVIILSSATVSLSYSAASYCVTDTVQSAALTGTGSFTGGSFSAFPGGMAIDAVTGAITPASTIPGNYAVTYSLPSIGVCPGIAAIANVTIAVPATANISYPVLNYCNTAPPQNPIVSGSGPFGGGTFSAFPAGLTLNATTGTIIPATSATGNYVITYTTPANVGCASATATAGVDISKEATVAIAYASAAYCQSQGAENVIISGTGPYTGGVFTANLPGLIINSATGTITPSSSLPGTYIVTYLLPTNGGCPAVQDTATVRIDAKSNVAISYPSSGYCSNSPPANVSLIGTGPFSGGSFSAIPLGLLIDVSDGVITPSGSSAGNYTVTYSVPASGVCGTFNITTTVHISDVSAASIAYPSANFCMSNPDQSVSLTGTGAFTGGTFSSSPVGLSIDAASGAISPGSSLAGNYTITYSATGIGGCSAVNASASIAISDASTAAISYSAGGYCSTSPDQPVSLTGTGTFAGGTFSAFPVGLAIDSATGSISPAGSSPGNYTITYSAPGSAGCGAINTDTTVNISDVSTASISYPSPSFCMSNPDQSATLTGTGAFTGGTFSSSPVGLTIDPATGAISPGSSLAGNYTITYSAPGIGGCSAVNATASITISDASTAAISYSAGGYCSTSPDQSVSLTGTGTFTGGTFSAFPVGLAIDSTTGSISPAGSSPGNYTITYSAPGSAGCGAINTDTTVNISDVSTASISYPSPSFCMSNPDQSAILTGTGAFTGGTFSSSPVGLTIDPATGAISPGSSLAGNYTITYSAPGIGDCANVSAITSLNITEAATVSITYPLVSFCTSALIQNVTLTGTGPYLGGTFNASPNGLIIDSLTGAISPTGSLTGSYMITYSTPAAGNCPSAQSATKINISDDVIANISYSDVSYCNSAPSQNATVNGSGTFSGGLFSALPAGLTIDSVTGTITPSLSAPGNYTISYTAPANSGCSPVNASTSVTIFEEATVTLAYLASGFCTTDVNQSPSISGTAIFLGGTFIAVPSGLTIDSLSGVFSPSSSQPGNYTITYTTPANGNCGAISATFNIIISPAATATIVYPAASFCTTSSVQTVNLNGTGSFSGGIFSVLPAGLSIDPSNGSINPAASSSGNYTVTYSAAGSGSCGLVTATATVSILQLPTASIVYPASAYCTNIANQQVTVNGTGLYLGGTFSASMGLAIDVASGTIHPSASTPGNYTVTYLIPGNGICGPISTSTNISVIIPPTASISYPAMEFCKSQTPQQVSLTGTGSYTGGIYSSIPAGLSINSSFGTITPSTSSAGNYTITYSTNTTAGCGSESATAIVTIHPQPVVTATPASATLCSEETTNILLSGVVPGTTFTWTVTETGVAGASGGTGDTISQLLSVTNNQPGTAIYTIIPSANGCNGAPVNVTVTVHPIPVPELSNGNICADPVTGAILNDFTLDSGLDATHTFQWFLDSVLIPDASGNTYTATAPGTYTVIATSAAGCVSPPATGVVSTVITATVVTLIGNVDFAEDAHITVTVNGNGTYEYQLDDGGFGSSNSFENLSSGLHVITVRDLEGCTNLSETFTVIGYPHYFTPNGDEFHETWNIWALSDQEFTRIFIFDRYGKLLKEISPAGKGWDGTYNGEPMPSTDYWFLVQYGLPEPHKEFRAHFSLKR
jgi:gliding motility-associated-like protein